MITGMRWVPLLIAAAGPMASPPPAQQERAGERVLRLLELPASGAYVVETTLVMTPLGDADFARSLKHARGALFRCVRTSTVEEAESLRRTRAFEENAVDRYVPIALSRLPAERYEERGTRRVSFDGEFWRYEEYREHPHQPGGMTVVNVFDRGGRWRAEVVGGEVVSCQRNPILEPYQQYVGSLGVLVVTAQRIRVAMGFAAEDGAIEPLADGCRATADFNPKQRVEALRRPWPCTPMDFGFTPGACEVSLARSGDGSEVLTAAWKDCLGSVLTLDELTWREGVALPSLRRTRFAPGTDFVIEQFVSAAVADPQRFAEREEDFRWRVSVGERIEDNRFGLPVRYDAGAEGELWSDAIVASTVEALAVEGESGPEMRAVASFPLAVREQGGESTVARWKRSGWAVPAVLGVVASAAMLLAMRRGKAIRS